ncbi:MAG: hypothetical protein KJ970_11160 [Candidatus Eisenbacteria bacterium]|uniref:SxtJ n=1 Tax=Eiseniibacteriota bacterium TaxID=2212470 RepID=A0A948RUY0_UNCEI|nr:hypothetical protein [Candidatus Eisenbacteria bacterium]MBU1948954.1 hypothetical protein [Candidatus Eisenbacteria bacterium]MBU2691475.1 hypothetical protein [Candidatus Eisenbacteria bacterium]
MTEQNHRGLPKEVRQFGYLVGGVLILLSGLSWWRDGKIPWPFLMAPGVLLMLMTLLKLAVMKPIYKYWMKFAHVLGWVMTRVILSVFYYIAVTPIGLIMRLTGHDPLKKKAVPQESYWERRDPEPTDPNQYRKQF